MNFVGQKLVTLCDAEKPLAADESEGTLHLFAPGNTALIQW
jgi:hypothetical protein